MLPAADQSTFSAFHCFEPVIFSPWILYTQETEESADSQSPSHLILSAIMFSSLLDVKSRYQNSFSEVLSY